MSGNKSGSWSNQDFGNAGTRGAREWEIKGEDMTYSEMVKKHGNISAASEAAGLARTTFRRRLAKEQGVPIANEKKTNGANEKKTKGIAEFRNLYDKDTIVPAKIKEGLKLLGQGGWEYESVFAKEYCGISMNDMATYRELFEDYIVPLRRDGKRVWAGSRAMAQQLRSMV